MARKPADPAARLAILKAARKRVRKGEKLGAFPMAEAAGMSWVNLRTMINGDENFPIERRGTNGVEWIFDARAVIDYLIRGCEAGLSERRKHNEKLARIAGFDVDEVPEVAGLSIDDLRKLADLVAQVQREKNRQGQLVSTAEMEKLSAQYHQVVLDAFMGAVQRIDPTGAIGPQEREKLDNELRNVLVKIQDAAQRWLEGIGAASQSRAG